MVQTNTLHKLCSTFTVFTRRKETLALLTAADDYFKTTVNAASRSKIKGLKIDLVTVNNVLVKANKKRAEYVAYIEEINQMKKLGIKDE